MATQNWDCLQISSITTTWSGCEMSHDLSEVKGLWDALAHDTGDAQNEWLQALSLSWSLEGRQEEQAGDWGISINHRQEEPWSSQNHQYRGESNRQEEPWSSQNHWQFHG